MERRAWRAQAFAPCVALAQAGVPGAGRAAGATTGCVNRILQYPGGKHPSFAASVGGSVTWGPSKGSGAADFSVVVFGHKVTILRGKGEFAMENVDAEIHGTCW